jgi:hypothetical protein
MLQHYNVVAAGAAGFAEFGLAAWAATSVTGDLAELDWAPSDTAQRAVTVGSDECPGATRCPLGGPCFAERARQRAAVADVVVVNMHLYGLHIASGGVILPEHDVLIVDEAHQLEDIMSDTVGLQIGPGRFTVLAGALVGLVLTRLRVLPGTTAAWGSSPGGAAAMVAMAEESGSDPRLVAFMQYVRVAAVVLSASLVARLLTDSVAAGPPPAVAEAATVLPVLVTLAVAAAGAGIALWLRLPAGALIGPSSYFMKSPPQQFPDAEALERTRAFMAGEEFAD